MVHASDLSTSGHPLPRGGVGEGLWLPHILGKAGGFFQFRFVTFPNTRTLFLPCLPRFSPDLSGSAFSLFGLRPQLDKIQKGLLPISHSPPLQQAPPPAPVARQIPLLLGHHGFFLPPKEAQIHRDPLNRPPTYTLTKQVDPKYLPYVNPCAQRGTIPKGGRGSRARGVRYEGDQLFRGW